MGRDIIITPNRSGTSSYSEIQFNGLTNSSIRLKVEDNGDLFFQGTSGTISNIYDNTSNLLLSIRGTAGTPIFQVSSNDYIQMGKYSSASLVVSSDKVGVGTTAPSAGLHIKGASGSFRLEDGNQVNGYIMSCDSNGVARWRSSATSSTSGGITFSAKPNYITKFANTGLTNSIMYQDNNKIGIGVTSSSGVLHIVGTSSDFSGFILKVDNSSSKPTFYVRNDGYIYSSINSTNTNVYYGGVLCEFINESYNSSTSFFTDIYNTFGSVTMSNLFKKNGDKLKSTFNGVTTGSNNVIKLSFGGFDIFDSGTFSGNYTWHLKSSMMVIANRRFKSESILTFALSDNTGTSFNALYQISFTSSNFASSFTMSLSAKGDNVVGYSGVVEFLPGSSN